MIRFIYIVCVRCRSLFVVFRKAQMPTYLASSTRDFFLVLAGIGQDEEQASSSSPLTETTPGSSAATSGVSV